MPRVLLNFDHYRDAWNVHFIADDFFAVAIVSECDTHSRSVNAAKPAEAQPLFTPEPATLE